MIDKYYTDPMETLVESPMNWAKEKLTGVKHGDVEDVPDMSSAKDITPTPDDAVKAALNVLISAYNNPGNFDPSSAEANEVRFKCLKKLVPI